MGSILKRKILIANTVGLGVEGITSSILTYIENMNRDDFQIFFTASLVDEGVYKRLKRCGCRIVKVPDRKTETLKYFCALIKLMRKEKPDVIHIHGNSSTMGIELVAAWLGGVKKRMVQSHSTQCDHKFANVVLKPLIYWLGNTRIACSKNVGDKMFGNHSFVVLNNGRSIELFSFNKEIREKMREKYQLKNNIVIGHVGSFLEVKNHEYIISVFREILKRRDNAILFFMGDGPLRAEIERKNLDIRENIVFTGAISNVPDMLCMMDGMLLPSFYEGFPLVVLEWQISGLPSIVSSNVTKDCVMTSFTSQLSIKEKPTVWAAELIEKIFNCDRSACSKEGAKKISDEGYNIKENVKLLEKLYRKR